VRECEWTIASGFEQCADLLALENPPTALVTASGELALGALAASRRARVSIPGDLALACFDDPYFAPLLEPSLTAVAYDTRRIGTEAARLLIAAMEDGAKQSEVRVEVSVIRRRSCGCEYDPAADLMEIVG
jgi:LacI family transcriptional regulator